MAGCGRSGRASVCWRAGRRRWKRLQSLAARLDTGWLAVVSRLKVENCGRQPAERTVWVVPQDQPAEAPRPVRVPLPRFEVVCEQPWEEMTPTPNPGVRF